jgi:hypothetical protein
MRLLLLLLQRFASRTDTFAFTRDPLSPAVAEVTMLSNGEAFAVLGAAKHPATSGTTTRDLLINEGMLRPFNHG